MRKTRKRKIRKGKIRKRKTSKGKTRKRKTRKGKTGEGETRERKVREGKTGERKVREGKTGEGKTREIVLPNPEFLVCSKGIGRSWFREFFMSDVFPHGRVITAQGTPAPVPRFYKELLKEVGSDLALEMYGRTMANFASASDKYELENTPSRRDARTVYAKARTGIFKRDVKGEPCCTIKLPVMIFQ